MTGPLGGRALPRLAALAAAVLFSTGGAAIKGCTLSGPQIASFRSLVAAAAVFLLLPKAREAWSFRVALVGVAYGSTMLLFVLSTKLTTAANAIFLQATAPLYLLFLAPLLLAEPLRRRQLPIVALVAIGMSMLFAEQREATQLATNPALGNLLAGASGLSWALTILGLRWLERSSADPGAALRSVVAGNLFTGLGALPFAFPLGGSSGADWWVIGYLGVFQIGLAYVLLTRAVRRLTALEVGLLLMLEPVLNPLWAWWLYGELPGFWALAGGGLILLAGVLDTLVSSRPPRPRSEV